MCDCGLRVTECINIRYNTIDFKERTLTVHSLKKRNKPSYRVIPLSQRLYTLLAEHINEVGAIQGHEFIFKNPSFPEKPISRFAVNKMLHRIQINNPVTAVNLHPHTLRHTFATLHLTAGTPLHNIKEMLGHVSLNTTLVYAHIPLEQLRQNVETVTNPKSKVKKYLDKMAKYLGFLRNKNHAYVNLHFSVTGIPTIGRNNVLKEILKNISNGTNTIIIGNLGVGKSHLLSIVKQQAQETKSAVAPRFLTIDNTSEIKPTLAQLLLYILQTDQKGVYQFLYPNYDYNKALAHISRDTVQNIANRIIEITPKKKYTLIIDNVDSITPKAVKILEIFKDHFTIITSARQVSVNRSSFLWNFDIIRLKELSRESAMKLIQSHSVGLQVQDYNLFRNYVYEQTNGNPRAIEEIINRYKKEPVITNDMIRSITHTGALPEIDCTFIILVFLACVACLRYLNHEVNNASFRVIGGIALVFLFISRYLVRYTKKSHI